MMRWTIIVWPLLAGACSNFESIEDACKDNVPGDRDAAPGAVQAFARLSCYRRFAGLNQARLNPAISRAVQNHVNYLENNVTAKDLTDPTVVIQLEESGRVGYTGDTPRERFDAEGYETDYQSIQTWSVFAGFPLDAPPRDFIDREIHDPLFRDALLAPGWRAGSWARGVLDLDPDQVDPKEGGYAFGYLEALLFLPSGQKAFNPVSYPVDGQDAVPTEWVNPYFIPPEYDIAQPEPFDEMPAVTGYPVSFTFGSDEVSGGDNPLDVQLKRSIFLGPDGIEVAHLVVFPKTYLGGDNTSTLALVPVDPLSPDTTYTVEVDVSWISREQLVKEISFTTASTAGPGYP